MAYKLTLWTTDEKVIELDEVFETREDADNRLEGIMEAGAEYNGKAIAFGKSERI
ncbi:MAG: hypothetical protein J6Z15_03905 [Oscillospiraceae bacterium]|nr:hypothetical protein [Oscillospiraceae bacterium]MBP5239721.1 hypothetical protein [Oscillospiraceae bacterium]MBP5744593.1 hypothetical protein [Oscillospiraceae bacterium]